VVASSEGTGPGELWFSSLLSALQSLRARALASGTTGDAENFLLDRRGIPTGEEERFAGFNDELGDNSFR